MAMEIIRHRWTGRMMPAEGFEPPTYGLQNRCTTTVLSRRGAGSYYSVWRTWLAAPVPPYPGAGRRSAAAEDDRGKRYRALRWRARGTARDIQIRRIPAGSP